jgi:hypothetical protein
VKFRIFIASMALALSVSACGQRSAAPVEEPSRPETAADADATPAATLRTISPDGAKVFFITPADGDTVSNPIRVEFGVEGISVVKAGDDQPNSGHHHLLIDTDLPELGAPVPADANHIHFGDGATSTEITLEPGQHTLRMLLGDHLHIPHDPPLVSGPITITVE